MASAEVTGARPNSWHAEVNLIRAGLFHLVAREIAGGDVSSEIMHGISQLDTLGSDGEAYVEKIRKVMTTGESSLRRGKTARRKKAKR
jgi:hypothetical protein